ncbi:hypothetical protein NDU88_003555 [Pleurodeles waltl]|uniref:Uncharacterized protein n=1 Tax=Pleurodeles waltl TaxID=8319 RepID=A0AAV7NK73_PLEWA|nr:hypothetical protein NDU88_003555 [Pleurodeles waltl]
MTKFTPSPTPWEQRKQHHPCDAEEYVPSLYSFLVFRGAPFTKCVPDKSYCGATGKPLDPSVTQFAFCTGTAFGKPAQKLAF